MRRRFRRPREHEADERAETRRAAAAVRVREHCFGFESQVHFVFVFVFVYCLHARKQAHLTPNRARQAAANGCAQRDTSGDVRRDRHEVGRDAC